MTRALKDARVAAGCYKGWKEEELPGFHEVRALSLHLYKRAGKDGQKIAGHASEEMTRNYQRDHADVVWSEVERTWISAKSLGGFAPVLRMFCAGTKKPTSRVGLSV
ncbi:MAG: hypothetical protein ACRYF9_02060 [Janthinobacterium lividum]